MWKTLAGIPRIIRDGASKFRSCGNRELPRHKKTFALTGHVANTGPDRGSLRYDPSQDHLRYRRWRDRRKKETWSKTVSKAVQIGGPSGGCLTEEHLDLPLDFDSLQSVGAMVGSGGLVVMKPRHLHGQRGQVFSWSSPKTNRAEKCVLCREGTKQMRALLDDIVEGRADEKTLEVLEELALAVKAGSLCGAWQDGSQPGSFDIATLPCRGRGPRNSKALPRRSVQSVGIARDYRRPLQKAARFCAKKMPCRRDPRRAETAAT